MESNALGPDQSEQTGNARSETVADNDELVVWIGFESPCHGTCDRSIRSTHSCRNLQEPSMDREGALDASAPPTGAFRSSRIGGRWFRRRGRSMRMRDRVVPILFGLEVCHFACKVGRDVIDRHGPTQADDDVAVWVV